jgi:hypothetical protein
MGVVVLHNTAPVELSGKIDSNISKAEESAKKRAEDRAARNEKRVKQHNEVIEKIYKDFQAAATRTLV